ncbi:hypothetical protein KQ304_10945 [Synechococcus sp. CS-1329]|nr:hypothetical protein [Synechococcus sp. CS-1329]
METPLYLKNIKPTQGSKHLVSTKKSLLDHNNKVDSSSILDATKEYLKELYSTYSNPKWFITIEYYPIVRSFEEAVNEARYINNMLLSKMLKCNKRKIKKHPERPLALWFHEKQNMIINQSNSRPRYGIGYHSHLHLGCCPDPYDTYNTEIKCLLGFYLTTKAQRISKNKSRFNQGVVILPWNYKRHAFYNLKDFSRFQNHQDRDLVLDIENMVVPESVNSECRSK